MVQPTIFIASHRPNNGAASRIIHGCNRNLWQLKAKWKSRKKNHNFHIWSCPWASQNPPSSISIILQWLTTLTAYPSGSLIRNPWNVVSNHLSHINVLISLLHQGQQMRRRITERWYFFVTSWEYQQQRQLNHQEMKISKVDNTRQSYSAARRGGGHK